MKEICDECFDCKFYIQNNDMDWDCVGQDKPCCEFIDLKENEYDQTKCNP